MSQLALADIKRYCQAVDFSADDQLLADLHKVAEEFVQKYTRRDLDAEFPGAWPEPCCQAVKLLVASWYREREAPVSDGVRDMLKPYRDLS
ncbi:head-tail connector protein [Marinibacterium profundimaris]|uniref:Phage gp6-like head-tail connector protein n=1 Tax=Marinibacterium profundimaris TaxID=1679460 RepID=A0A225NRN2_9RHOB|nr:head-tail connector protein [Marinibacterium profundimaris]OWU77604.1 hypothetical protein ATO3_02650 [Marinibacterium profundimaris]